ncbi:MAG: glyoxalase [Chloroflexi bacterium]|nr:MAG: glyoxalase [Chloroflexota bacterium]
MIHHVQLGAPAGSEPLSRAFWSELLGFDEVAKPTDLAERGGCWFRRGQIEIHVGAEEGFRPARRAHPGLLVEDLDREAERLARAGIAVEWDDHLPGMRRFYASDPHANRLEFLQPAQHITPNVGC